MAKATVPTIFNIASSGNCEAKKISHKPKFVPRIKFVAKLVRTTFTPKLKIRPRVLKLLSLQKIESKIGRVT